MACHFCDKCPPRDATILIASLNVLAKLAIGIEFESSEMLPHRKVNMSSAPPQQWLRAKWAIFSSPFAEASTRTCDAAPFGKKSRRVSRKMGLWVPHCGCFCKHSANQYLASYTINQGSPRPLATLNPFGRELLLLDVSTGFKRSTWIQRTIWPYI